MKRVVALEPREFPEEFNYQLFPYEEWVLQGGEGVRPYSSSMLRWLTSRLEFPRMFEGDSAFLYFTGGGSIRQGAWPYYLINEIIPMIWDCWPGCFELVCGFLERKKVKTCILTSTTNVNKIKNRFPDMNLLYVPEAVKVDGYKMGKDLSKREIDVLEYGRPNKSIILKTGWDKEINHVYNSDGIPLFRSSALFRDALSDSKLTLAFPRCDTQPEIAGDVETLTQRYWENMLSRVVMVGRAPRELVELIGYNPVIDIDKINPEKQMLDILNHIQDYQSFVDKNRETALEKGDWSSRMKQIRSFLRINNYEV